tara:strand:- start:8418 stop:10904 length:2487 start_codon:yes stop_codon:yes gene_type:complete
MGSTRRHLSSFHSGELDPKLIARNDQAAYGDGLQKARNIICRNQGPVERRPGTYFRADLGAESRLESFIFSGDQEYIFAFQNTVLKIYSTAGVLLQTLTSQPWDTADLFELNVAQKKDVMIVAHEDFMPRVITRTGATTFTSAALSFDSSVNAEKTYQPYFKFAADTITLDINSITKGDTNVTCTSSADYFTSAYVGTTIRYMGAELDITAYTNATTVTATLKEVPIMELDEDPFATSAGSGVVVVTHVGHGFSTGASVTIAGTEDIFDTDGNGLAFSNLNGAKTITVVDDNHYQFTAASGDTATESVDGGGVRVTISGHPATRDWDEQVMSPVNGYPKAVCFHEQRLFFGGVTNLPDGIQASKVSQFFNFDVGDGEDADSVQIQIASNQINEIRHLISNQNIEILTSRGEFYLKPPIGKAITPSDIQIKKQSNYGVQQKGMPRSYNGTTNFIQNNGINIREYLYDPSGEAYQSALINVLAPHLFSTPTDTASIDSLPDRTEQFYFVVNSGDGTLAVFSAQRAQKIFGWMLWSTDGTFESVTCTTNNIYVSVKRTINSATVYYLEQLASTSFDIPTDMTVTKTLSASYQPHGSPLTKGTTSSSTGLIADGFTNAPQVGEKFKFAGTGTEYTINAVATTSTSGEYSITLNAAVSTSDNVELRFTFSKTWSGLNSAPDMRGLTVYGTSGSTEGATDINYYGDGTVTSGGVVVLDSVATAIDIGLNYTVQADTMPTDVQVKSSGSVATLTGAPRKIAKAIFELENTYNLKVNTKDVYVNSVSDLDTSTGLTAFTGQKEVHFLGYSTKPFISITQSAPLPMRVLTITEEIYY